MTIRQDSHDAKLLATDVANIFVVTDSGRILHENDPEHSPGPRMYFAGCASGNILRIRHDVGVDTERAIQALATDEPPLSSPDNNPVFLDDYIRLLATEAPVERQEPGLIYCFPQQFLYENDVAVVSFGTPAGDQLLTILEAGMPQSLIEIGFTSPVHFWEPWSVAVFEGEIASVCISARLGESGAEAGVTTIPSLRGRGFGAAATAAWASQPSLRERALFYSTGRSNVSSQRIAARLGLHLFGASLRVY